jgi:hypothetical protein
MLRFGAGALTTAHTKSHNYIQAKISVKQLQMDRSFIYIAGLD